MQRLTPEQIRACFEYAERAERGERRARWTGRLAAAAVGLVLAALLFFGY